MIEDDSELALILSDYLGMHGFVIECFEEPYSGLGAVNAGAYDLLILDLSLPGMDGLEVCAKLQSCNIPIIISSARSDIEDKIQALDIGADDYLPKPYDPKELIARIRSVLRRYSGKKRKTPPPKQPFASDMEHGYILKNNTPLELTAAEREIMHALIQKQGAPLSRDEILYNFTHIDSGSSYKTIDVIISRLRAKIKSGEKRYIQTVRGIGYKLENR